MTLEDIGDHVGLTRERVRQIKDKALIKLKNGTNGQKLQALLRGDSINVEDKKADTSPIMDIKALAREHSRRNTRSQITHTLQAVPVVYTSTSGSEREQHVVLTTKKITEIITPHQGATIQDLGTKNIPLDNHTVRSYIQQHRATPTIYANVTNIQDFGVSAEQRTTFVDHITQAAADRKKPISYFSLTSLCRPYRILPYKAFYKLVKDYIFGELDAKQQDFMELFLKADGDVTDIVEKT